MSELTPSPESLKRFYVSWYNRRGLKFDNGITWFRVSVRYNDDWHELGGLWWSRHWPFFSILFRDPDGPSGPPRRWQYHD